MKAKGFVLIGLGVSLIMAVALSPLASSSPDGLERVAEDNGFLNKAEEPGAAVWESPPIPDYEMPGVGGPPATSLAGLIGTVGTFLVGFGIASVLGRRKAQA